MSQSKNAVTTSLAPETLEWNVTHYANDALDTQTVALSRPNDPDRTKQVYQSYQPMYSYISAKLSLEGIALETLGNRSERRSEIAIGTITTTPDGTPVSFEQGGVLEE